MFIGRKKELAALQERYESGKAELVAIWGRRRVGKTELIKQFLKDKRGAYFLCVKEGWLESLQRLSKTMARKTGGVAPAIGGVDDFCHYAENACGDRFVIVLDEFPYLAEADRAATSIWQAIWDEHLAKTNAYLIICGSSIAMMEREVFGEKSPLYGRRTGQIRLAPLSFRETARFYPSADAKRAAELYFISGGIPLYAEMLEGGKTVSQNAIEKIARKESRLYAEPELLLKSELRQTKVYHSVLRAIAAGKATTNEISQEAKVPAGQIMPYLYALEELGIIRAITPAGEGRPASKITLRELADNFLCFYYRFIEPNHELAELGDEREMKAVIEDGFPAYAGRRFEEVARQMLLESGRAFPVTGYGKWWNRRGEEIDLVAFSEITGDILFVETKWTRLKPKEREAVIEKLKRKSGLVGWRAGNRKEHFMAFDISDLEKAFAKGA